MPKEPSDERGSGVETDMTERVLLSLVFDVSCLAENVEQVKVKILTLAKERGIKTP